MRNPVHQNKFLQAIDCVIFGFDGEFFKTLLIRRMEQPEKGKWSLMGGFVKEKESFDQASNRIIKQVINTDNVYMEQLKTFGDPNRDPIERTISTTYFALIDLTGSKHFINNNLNSAWFSIRSLPPLVYDHAQMIDCAIKELRYKAILQPLLFELLPKRFTLPQLQLLYESVYEVPQDKRNFSKRILEMGILIKQTQKDKFTSRKGAFYYQLNLQNYYEKFRV